MELYTALKQARAVLPPLTRCWRVLAFNAVCAWEEFDFVLVMGNSTVTITDFLEGRQEVVFAVNTLEASTLDDDRFTDPRFAGMMFAITAMFPRNSHPYVHASVAKSIETSCSIARQLRINLDVEAIRGVIDDGLENQGWGIYNDIAIKWLRVWSSARRIQRAWRRMTRCKRQMRAQLWVPRLVSMLQALENEPAAPLLPDEALGVLLGV